MTRVVVGWECVGTTFPYIFWGGNVVPILFCTSNGTWVEDVRSTRLH